MDTHTKNLIQFLEDVQIVCTYDQLNAKLTFEADEQISIEME